MTNLKLCAAAASVALVSATFSLTAAPPDAEAATDEVIEAEPLESAAFPAMVAIAVVATGGAFVLGIVQGYAEAKNEQAEAAAGGVRKRDSEFRMEGFDHVLD